jgi:hypothetical protein
MSDLDDNNVSDVCDLLGMSSIFNKDEINNKINSKTVEKELIRNSLEIDEDETFNDKLLEYNPLNEYNNIIENIIENKQPTASNYDLSIKESSENWKSSNNTNYDDDDDEYNDIMNFADTKVTNTHKEDKDSFSYKLTQEQTNQKIVDKVLNFSNENENDQFNFNIDDENREDMKLTLLEKIDNLIEELEDDGVNLDKIPKVDYTSNLEKIEYVAKLLMLKSNRNRYSGLGEEFILAIAGGLEILCDGKREFLGIKPNLVGYSDVVKVKLRRVKNDTSQIVSNVVEKYEMSPIMTLLIELIPGLFLHSRRRSSQVYDNLYTDLNDDITEIRKYNN